MPTILGSTKASITTSPNVVVNAPTLEDGCTVFLFLLGRGGIGVTTPPAGFDAVPDASAQSSGTAAGARVHTYERHVPDASAEPATYTCTMGSNLNGSVIAVSVADADPTGPVQVALVQLDAAGADADLVAPSVDTTSDDTLILRLAAMTSTVGVASWASADCTELQDAATVAATNRCSGAVGWEDQPTAGATGTATWTASMVGGSTSYGSGLGLTIAVTGTQVIADAGDNQSAEPGELVQLDGTASTGAITARQWSQVGGAVTTILAGATTATATFFAPKPPGTTPMVLTFQHEVESLDGDDTDTTTVTVIPATGSSLGVFILDAAGDPT